MSLSPELGGGAGFTFEEAVVAHFMSALLCESAAEGMPDRIVSRVALQQRDFGEPLDDLIIDFSADGSPARLSLQVKRHLIISSANSNHDFREVVHNSWRTLQKPDFRHGTDRYGGATGWVAASKAQSLRRLCEAARASASVEDFEKRFGKEGNASQDQRAVLDSFRTLLEELGSCSIADLHRLLSHFQLLTFDQLHEGAGDPPNSINALRGALASEQENSAPALLDRLRRLAREGMGLSATFDRPTLVGKIGQSFGLRGAPSLVGDLDRLRQLTITAAQDIDDDVQGTRLERQSLREQLDSQLGEYRFVQIQGLPGSGKSVLLRRRVEAELDKGPVLLLKSDRLEGHSWASFAAHHGLASTNLRELLVEVGATGSSVLYVDAIDRIDRPHRAIIKDVVRAILHSPMLAEWRIVVTLRDTGIEPLRTWLPAELFDQAGVATVEVKPLDDSEAEELAKDQPALGSLLFGPKAVQEIVRRPFFAKILAQGSQMPSGDDTFSPQSEIDLIDNWWRHGGYDSTGTASIKRQRALLKLASYRARHLDTLIPLNALTSPTIDVINGLTTDGILQEVKSGHTLRFAHDIFFEWAFYHHLIDCGDNWLIALSEAGEPPAIGRVIELLSQYEFIHGEAWESTLARIKHSGLRPQWTRAWLLAPLGLQGFDVLEDRFFEVVSANQFQLLRKVLVWVQAEKTTPNPVVLSGKLGTQQQELAERIRVADLLAWPSDYSAWVRLIAFIDRRLPELPANLIRDIVVVFQVWQNVFGDIPNSTSSTIIKHCDGWLREGLPRGSGTGDLGQSIRELLFRSARSYPGFTRSYLESLRTQKRSLDHIFDELMIFAPILAEVQPQILADLTLLHLKGELPEDRLSRGLRHGGAATRGEHDWRELSIDGYTEYFPPSPLREPFHSLFLHAPDQALRVLKELSNHAISAWRQLNRLDRERGGTPIPVNIPFPWGSQTFWGGRREYLWSRGVCAPNALASAYFALEHWALAELDRETSAEALIQQIVPGNECIAILGTAMVIALHSKVASDAIQSLLSTQRLWQADLERHVQEPSIRSDSKIGFRPDQIRHAQAVDELNNRPVRQYELRHLLPLYVLNSDSQRAEAMRAAILRFETDLPFEFDEDRTVLAIRQELAENARNCVEWARPKNYQMVSHPEDPERQGIVHVNPQAETPDAQARLEEHQTKTSVFLLFQWARKSLEERAVSGEFDSAEAVALAKELDRLDLYEHQGNDPISDVTRGAVAGAAAVVLAYQPQAEDDLLAWARGIIARAAKVPEEHNPWTSGDVIPWHPCIFVARALGAELDRDAEDVKSAIRLLALVGHPRECVSLVALEQLFVLWPKAPRLAWCGLALGLNLCQGSRRVSIARARATDSQDDDRSRERAVDAAIEAYLTEDYWTELPLAPPAWVERDVPGGPVDGDENEVSVIGDRHDRGRWRSPDTIWYSRFASKIMDRLPVGEVMVGTISRAQFLSFARAFLAWTIEKISPGWRTSDQHDREYGIEVFEWRESFSRVLGYTVGHLDADEISADYLDPICALGDEPCFSVLAPLVDGYVCAHVYDAPTIAASSQHVLDKTLTRFLQAQEFKPDSYRPGELLGREMKMLTKALFFVSVEKAMGARRFANGDWTNIAAVVPTVDRFVRGAGWSAAVMNEYLTLCERSQEDFPADIWADQILSLLESEDMDLVLWRGTSIPARIAGLVQHFSNRESPLASSLAQKLLRILDALVDFGDRRSAALQNSPAFRQVRVDAG